MKPLRLKLETRTHRMGFNHISYILSFDSGNEAPYNKMWCMAFDYSDPDTGGHRQFYAWVKDDDTLQVVIMEE